MKGRRPADPQVAWEKARTSLETARVGLESGDFDSSISRSFYAAFYAVSALFTLEGKDFYKHTELLRAVHRDLVSTGLWEPSLGAAFSELFQERLHADYDLGAIANEKEARRALELASQLIEAVHKTRPEDFKLPQGWDD